MTTPHAQVGGTRTAQLAAAETGAGAGIRSRLWATHHSAGLLGCREVPKLARSPSRCRVRWIAAAAPLPSSRQPRCGERTMPGHRRTQPSHVKDLHRRLRSRFQLADSPTAGNRRTARGPAGHRKQPRPRPRKMATTVAKALRRRWNMDGPPVHACSKRIDGRVNSRQPALGRRSNGVGGGSGISGSRSSAKWELPGVDQHFSTTTKSVRSSVLLSAMAEAAWHGRHRSFDAFVSVAAFHRVRAVHGLHHENAC